MAREIKKILIANRGEIAVRIIRSCWKMGIRTVAIYSEADRGHSHTKLADEAYCVGGVEAKDSYLNSVRILEIAQQSGADAIHPGYGFLSENPDFAEAVEKSGMIFIGPRPESMRMLGHKDRARQVATQAGVPIVPGYDGEKQDLSTLLTEAQLIGFPLLIKARAGGGGRGIRRVDNPDQFAQALESAKREALAFFNDDRLILEKLIINPRHIEVQLFGDQAGNVIHLFERDCTLQRRHQKVIEEAPAVDLSSALRETILASAIAIARTSKLENASTAEFLVSGTTFYFLEVNCRIQVEHPVTELITSLDLIELQIRIARGETLNVQQSEISCRGAAVEARLYAEDPARGFLPRNGVISSLVFPEMTEISTVRIDHALHQGMEVTSHYDAMLAKIIAWGRNRGEALRKLRLALTRLEVNGVGTNKNFLIRLLDDPQFQAGDIWVTYIDEKLAQLTLPTKTTLEEAERAVAAFLLLRSELLSRSRSQRSSNYDPFDALPRQPTKLTLPKNPVIDLSYSVTNDVGEIFNCAGPITTLHAESGALIAADIIVDQNDYRVEVLGRETASYLPTWLEIGGIRAQIKFQPIALDRTRVERAAVTIDGRRFEVVELLQNVATESAHTSGKTSVKAPLPGKLLAIKTTVGARVDAGQTLLIIESMKMEHAVVTPISGTVTLLVGNAGENVREGQELATIDRS